MSLESMFGTVYNNLMKELGTEKNCIYCGKAEYDIEAKFCDPDDFSRHSFDFEEGFTPCLLLTCTVCGKMRVKTLLPGPKHIHYIPE